MTCFYCISFIDTDEADTYVYIPDKLNNRKTYFHSECYQQATGADIPNPRCEWMNNLLTDQPEVNND